MRNVASLGDANHLVDPDVFEIAQTLAEYFRRADAILRAPFGEREFVRIGLVLVPDVGPAGHMFAEEAVVAEAVDEESVAFHGDFGHPLLVTIAQKRAGDRELGI